MDIYLEIGKKRVFAGALEWPGWCRSGRDEAAALQALLDYGPRYARAIGAARLEFQAPADVSQLVVVQRLNGNASTDFGAPDIPPASDAGPLDNTALERLQRLLQACWQTFDATTRAASGRALRKGPRGGGRDLEGIVQHVMDAQAAYLRRLGWKPVAAEGGDVAGSPGHIRQAMVSALEAAAHGEMPTQGPRGGARWTPRYFVRRAAWHVLDHAWEIEDRVLAG